ncbi:uncharacterized protein LOC116776923 isoform X2 [Danaus plexippus]|uniref:uncharacterized protein LOC116776923 isoform X2 n=1 Tax=Danaus plexippus TaxID=13037 RepID=UPI002AB18B2A|nr:uncharacterized protein LOC116776923 isoform X2 [Danaus plexippus]
MIEKSAKSSALPAGVVIVINLLSMILCIFVFAVSLLSIAAPSTVLYFINSFGSSFMKALLTEDTHLFQLGIAGALLSGFVFCISFMGLYGAITSSKFLLVMYAAIVFLLLLLECSVMYYLSSNLLEKGFQKQDVYFNHAVRANLECCELNVTSTPDVKPPWSCCDQEFYSTNCTIDNIHDLALSVSLAHLATTAPLWRAKKSFSRDSCITRPRS